MISTARLEREIAVHYPRMEGAPAYRAEVLADLNGVDELQVRALLVSGGYVSEDDFYCVEPKRRRTKLEWDMIEPLYKNGLTDHEIASAIGFSHSVVAAVRKRCGFRANKSSMPLDQDRAMALYQEGCNDREISRKLGVSVTTVNRWRNKHGLSMNFEGRGPQPCAG